MNSIKQVVPPLRRADLQNGSYQNPLLYEDYSDPDVIRVGDTYYMTASSFNFMPGLPILISKDLVNWKLVNYAVRCLPYKDYEKPAHAKGIWAPSIRFHKNRFYIYFGMPDEGIFMTSTMDPLKEWAPPVCLKEGKGLIDTCPFWEEDGRGYLVHAYANSRAGIKSKLAIFELNEAGDQLLGEDRIIYDGTLTQPTIEGPKVYKKNGFYYIFAPAGGVKYGWQTVLRSPSIYGPYEEKIVLQQGDTDINGPHQGGLVDTQEGEEWFLHFQQKGAYGRIPHLQPVNWSDGWPVIGIDSNSDGIGEPIKEYRKPLEVPADYLKEYWAAEDFSASELSLSWQWMANYKKEFFSLTEIPGSLVLYPVNTTNETTALLWNSANVLTRKIDRLSFRGETKLDISELTNGRSGIVIIGNQYAALCVEKNELEIKLIYLESEGEGESRREIIKKEVVINNCSSICLSQTFYPDESCEFRYKIHEEAWSAPTKRFTPEGAVWVGVRTGIFAIADDNCGKGRVRFEYFEMTDFN